MKKILILTKEYHHPQLSASGGTGVFYQNLARQLAKLGFDVTVFGTFKNKADFKENGIQHTFVKDYFKKYKLVEFGRSLSGKFAIFNKINHWFYLQEKKYITKQLKQFLKARSISPDIIETHDWDGISLFLDQLSIPYVVRCHGSWTVLEKEFGYKNVASGKKYCEKLALQKSQNTVVISEFSQKINQEIFDINNTKLIYNGIDINFYSPSKTSDIIPFSIFFFGNVSIEKGADRALQVFDKIKSQFPESTMHFIGNSNNFEKKLDQYVNRQIQKDIFFYGNKNANEVKPLLSRAVVVLFPSKGENFSLALLETMALEKAVICSNIPAFVEIIKPNEIGIIANSVDEFTSITASLFQNNSQVESLGKLARLEVCRHFTQEKMIAETINYYKEVEKICNNKH